VSLSWHFADLDTIDEPTARRLLADLPGDQAPAPPA
jgi:hypothetical protein